MATATTRTGLSVFTTILDKTYQTGRKVAKDFKLNYGVTGSLSEQTATISINAGISLV